MSLPWGLEGRLPAREAGQESGLLKLGMAVLQSAGKSMEEEEAG